MRGETTLSGNTDHLRWCFVEMFKTFLYFTRMCNENVAIDVTKHLLYIYDNNQELLQMELQILRY